MVEDLHKKLMQIYRKLYKAYGPQYWWPGDTPFEIIIGAILTQNTSWKNVEKAIDNLKTAGILTPESLYNMRIARLAKLIMSSGYYNQKAQKLKNFISFLYAEYRGDLDAMLQGEIHTIRKKLLQIKGVGQETADSIILYAAGKPIFVVDAYTYRIFSRIGLIYEDVTYEEMQDLFMSNLRQNRKLFNEYHALIVMHGKDMCKKNPSCAHCSIKGICNYYSKRSKRIFQ